MESTPTPQQRIAELDRGPYTLPELVGVFEQMPRKTLARVWVAMVIDAVSVDGESDISLRNLARVLNVVSHRLYYRTTSPARESGALTSGEVARMLGMSSRMGARLIDNGDVPGWRVGHDRRTKRADVIAYAREHGIPIDEDQT